MVERSLSMREVLGSIPGASKGTFENESIFGSSFVLCMILRFEKSICKRMVYWIDYGVLSQNVSVYFPQ